MRKAPPFGRAFPDIFWIRKWLLWLIVVPNQDCKCFFGVAVDCLGVLATVVVVYDSAIAFQHQLADSTVADSEMARLIVVLHPVMENAPSDSYCPFVPHSKTSIFSLFSPFGIMYITVFPAISQRYFG